MRAAEAGEVEESLRPLSPGRAETAAQLTIGEKRPQRVRERGRVSGRDDHPGLAVANELA